MAARNWRETEHPVIHPQFQRTCQPDFRTSAEVPRTVGVLTALTVRLKYVEDKAERAIQLET